MGLKGAPCGLGHSMEPKSVLGCPRRKNTGEPMDEEERVFRVTMEAEGEAVVRAKVERGNVLSPKHMHMARTWLNEKQIVRDREREERAERDTAAAERSAGATERAADAADRSEKHARSAARWAMWAVIVSVVALVVSIVR